MEFVLKEKYMKESENGEEHSGGRSYGRFVKNKLIDK